MPALDALITSGGPASYTWDVREGDNPALQFTVKLAGVAVDLTGVTGACSIRQDYAATSDIVVPTITFPNAAGGVVRASLSSAQTTTLAAAITGTPPATQQYVDVGYFDVELQDGTNQWTCIGGLVRISREITP
jgi:hypothetical protein